MAEEEIQQTVENSEDSETNEAKTETVEPTPVESAASTADTGGPAQNLDFLLDVPVKLTAELGSCKMTMQELLDLDIGAVVQLDQPANANVDVFVNHKLVARGEVVVAEENFGIRIKDIIAKPN
ncbi:MAG: flagellar motor switch protein FliN [Verrucomicrobiota bacterium]|nr:flagellar motor switch protein FliN [Verrucomicrobiota bacterium]